MLKVILVASGKGGTGKTSLTAGVGESADLCGIALRQYRIIEQERFASKFCVLTRRGFAVILDVLP